MTGLMTRLIVAVALVFCAAVAHAEEKRTCSDEEERQADRQLALFSQDTNRSHASIEQHLPFGAHLGTHASQGSPTNEELLVQAGYVIMHDGDLRTALWTAHRLTREDVIRGESKDRVECFRPDIRLPEDHAAIKEDYEEPIFDRGHMTSDRDLRDNLTEQLNSYILSNMAPQYSSFNSGLWKKLEDMGRDWAKAYETVYVTSGALFDFNHRDNRDKDEMAARMGSHHQTARVAIASHFYKIFLRRSGNGWCTIAFLLKHYNRSGAGTVRRRLQDAIESLATIEEPAEIMFHPKLDRTEIWESLDGSGWGLASGETIDNTACGSPRVEH